MIVFTLDDWEAIIGYHSIGLWFPSQYDNSGDYPFYISHPCLLYFIEYCLRHPGSGGHLHFLDTAINNQRKEADLPYHLQHAPAPVDLDPKCFIYCSGSMHMCLPNLKRIMLVGQLDRLALIID